jgi:glycerol dehydrogenase
MLEVKLPSYTIEKDAFRTITDICPAYGKTCVIVYGKTAWSKTKERLLPEIKKAGIKVLNTFFYGGEASYENIAALKAEPVLQEADMVFAVGGGKCLDTAKVTAKETGKPIFTVPTIAATCAAVTAISILYYPDGSFREIYRLGLVPTYAFIDTTIIARAPRKYLWAGIGDTMAKYFEVAFSCRNDTLDHSSAMAKSISSLCYKPIVEYGEKALAACDNEVPDEALKEVVSNIIVSTGLTSILVDPAYNSAVAHALFYGLTLRKHIEKDHLHGEVVAYGILVQLMLDQQTDDLRNLLPFYKAIGLPVCLADLELSAQDPMDDILKKAEENPELEHVPYPVTADMIRKAILDLERFHEV